ncbi:site-specific integrase [Rhodococcus sp. IEGM 1330]|uniref:tyrosine-type recombinase/integrase n=1 Tax=Rhodococcus sp. IEGM 1330 TaxID=3082225 RepID=UPI002952EDC0|nr:site-specific integrase [Rhodococcus sp. IEGM 1330]MDV8022230.1 site-specific integrase [Rhodococcus sp. IEGM 1330]
MSGTRSNGDGTIYKRKDGRFEGAAYVVTNTGTRKRIRVYGATRDEARLKLTAQLAQADKGIPTPDRAWTVGQYLDYWMTEVVPTTRRPATVLSYESAVRIHIKPRLGSQSLTKLTVQQLQRVLNKQREDGHSVRVVRLTRTVLSAALTRAMREEIVTRNVARLVELPAWKRKDITPWSVSEVQRFLDTVQNDRMYPAFLMLVLYGLRRGELLGLRWSDVDFNENIVHVRQQLQQLANSVATGPIKTDAGVRDLPLIPVVRRALLQHEAVSAPGDDTDRLIFLGTTGAPLWPRNFVKRFHKLRERAGLRRITIHHLRHTAATILKNAGVPARDAQLILGHAHITTTQQFYQHADIEGQKTALTKVGQVLLTGVDGDRCRQVQPSNAILRGLNGWITNGGPAGTRTPDTLLKRPQPAGGEVSLTSVIKHQRTRAYAAVLGFVAVSGSRQNSEYDQGVVGVKDYLILAVKSLRQTVRPELRPRPWNVTTTDWTQR